MGYFVGMAQGSKKPGCFCSWVFRMFELEYNENVPTTCKFFNASMMGGDN